MLTSRSRLPSRPGSSSPRIPRPLVGLACSALLWAAGTTALQAEASPWNKAWPVLRTYGGSHTAAIAMPLGGIGTGTVSLGGRGNLQDWEVVNRGAIGWIPAFRLVEPTIATAPFFVMYARPAGGQPTTLLLEGPVPKRESNYSGDWGADTFNAGLPRFEHNTFAAAYPLAQVAFADPAMPLQVRLEAFNPLIPGDADRSGIPVAVLRYVVTNPTAQRYDVSIGGVIPNFIGCDGWDGKPKGNRNQFRHEGQLQGLFMDAPHLDRADRNWGTFAFTTTATTGVSYRTTWNPLAWNWSFRDFWDDFSQDGTLQEPAGPNKIDTPPACLAVKVSLAPGESRTITFLLTWHFPNRASWTNPPTAKTDITIGNYYTTKYADAWDVAAKVAAQLPGLEHDTVQFVGAVTDSDFPDVLKEAGLFNLAVLRSQTVFRTPDGLMFGWEGEGSLQGTKIGEAKPDRGGWGFGTCTHVWNYEQATPFLFGDLSMSMRRVEFMYSTNPQTGKQDCRAMLPLRRDGASNFSIPAADGQMGSIVKMYRDWQLSGDTAALRAMWTHVRAALAYAWQGGRWDTKKVGVMDGPQLNTMDVEYVGPNPQMACWYLAALRAGEEMAKAVNDDAFAAQCDALYRRGRAWVDANLFNGQYYIQKLPDPEHPPKAQLGEGILVDQLVGQYLAHLAGLGYVLDRQHERTTLRTIMRENWVADFNKHFNPLRSFAVGDEQGLVMAAYPPGKLLAFPFPYFGEVMTGFEYSTGALMIMEGMPQDGLKVFSAVRARFDGVKRNPFDEGEYGHRYARSMASWSGMLAWSGFNFSAIGQEMRVDQRPGRYFWSNGYAYGQYTVEPAGPQAKRVTIDVLRGNLDLRQFDLTGFGRTRFDAPLHWSAATSRTFLVPAVAAESLPATEANETVPDRGAALPSANPSAGE